MEPSTLEVLSARTGCKVVIKITNLNYISVTQQTQVLLGNVNSAQLQHIPVLKLLVSTFGAEECNQTSERFHRTRQVPCCPAFKKPTSSPWLGKLTTEIDNGTNVTQSILRGIEHRIL